ncbi:MAG: hypothetical protein HY286_06205 [Planctomycetes bacterium]|nr:hypothetical protein [Planctomycetota bacterium]
MEYPDRRLAELAALDAHRRAAADPMSNDPAALFRLGMFTHSLAQELIVESIVSYREAAKRLEASGARGEAWERAMALVALNHLMLGERGASRSALDLILQNNAASPSGIAILAELYYRENDDEAGDAELAKIPQDEHGHPVVAAVLDSRARRGGRSEH